MATVVLFHPVLGVREGTLDAARRLRSAGHEVVIADLFDGRTFDAYEPAIAFAEGELGHATLLQRADAAVANEPNGFVVVGYSLGCVMAVHVATQRRVAGVVMVAGAIPPSALGSGATWPRGVPAQRHATVDDPWGEQDLLDQARLEIEHADAELVNFDYPGSGHLFMDPTLPDEYDRAAADLFYSRLLNFVQSVG